MKITRGQLKRIIKEELALMAAPEVALDMGAFAVPADGQLRDELGSFLGCVRAAHLWFHSAHNLAKGPGFAGDHIEIYGEIYGKLSADYDTAAEKAISLTGDESVVCPHTVVSLASQALQQHPSPVGMSADSLAVAALGVMLNLNEKVTALYDSLEASGVLSLGLNDFLAATANQYETYVYMLQQRTKN